MYVSCQYISLIIAHKQDDTLNCYSDTTKYLYLSCSNDSEGIMKYTYPSQNQGTNKVQIYTKLK